LDKPEKKGFRRFVPLLILIGVLLLAIAFVLLLPVIKNTFPADNAASTSSTATTYTLIAQEDSQTLDTITVSHADGDSYTLAYQDGMLALVLDNGETELINDSYTDSIIKYATQVYIMETVVEDESEYLENLPDMGLDPPQIEVVSTFTDGSAITIDLGYNLNTTTEYYFRWSGDSAIYFCNSSVYQTFEYTADMLLTIDQPSVLSTLVERISILPHGEDAIVCTFETDENDTVTGTLQSPFVYPMDQNAADTLLTAAENFRLGTRVGAVTDENSADYGFDSAQVVIKIAQREGLYSTTDSDGVLQTYTVPASDLTLTIGDQEGEFFYYCEVDDFCYRVSSFLIASFLHADAMNYVTLQPADLGDAVLQSITLQTGDGTLNIRATYTESVLPNNELETDENGDIVYTTEITANGEAITEEAFDDFMSRLAQMTVSGKLSSVSEPDGTPKWQMILTTTQGKTRTLTAYTMDSFSDMLAVDGVAMHYINNEALEIAMGDFAALLTQTDTQ